MLYNKKVYLGVDVGSVSTNLVLIDSQNNLIEKLYLRTMGQPIRVIKEGLDILKSKISDDTVVEGVGTTGSGRRLAGLILGADVIKNEITTHALAALHLIPDVRTVIEIGGQDSKITLLRNGIVSDFAMNTVCAAGTGSFLDRQAGRLNIQIEEFGDYALKAQNPVRIAGRCAVFAESDMIHKQQAGHSIEDIVAGLCEALARNFLSNIAKGKKIEEPVIFQGGVAANKGMVKAFEYALGAKITVPQYYDVMGAYGAALLARQTVIQNGLGTNFKGFNIKDLEFRTRSFICQGCTNLCEVVEIVSDGTPVGRWGDRCGKWTAMIEKSGKTESA